MKKTIAIDYPKLRTVVCLYTALPMFLFFVGFVKWYYALASTAALIYVCFCLIRSPNTGKDHEGTLVLPWRWIGYIFLFILLWTYLGGLNGFYYQSSDWDCRNAIFHDLIFYEWPVFYQSTGAALVYYIGHWLPPAVFGKMILLLTGSENLAWLLGKMAFWLWTGLGLLLVILLILHYLKVSHPGRIFLATILFAGFSGLDIIGVYLERIGWWLFSPEVLHLEWWSPYQFSAITSCVYWVFNQTVIPWMLTLCFVMEKDPRNYVYYCVVCLLCGPLPCIGLAFCMIVRAVCFGYTCVKEGQWKTIVKMIFSRGNVTAFLLMFPVIAAYTLSNSIATAVSGETAQLAVTKAPFFSLEYWDKNLLYFLILEVGCYLFLIFRDHRKDPLYYTLIVSFILCPYFYIGFSNDFCMRASVPAILILAIYVIDYIQKHIPWDGSKLTAARGVLLYEYLCGLALAVCLMIGFANPMMELYRGFYHVIHQGTVMLEDMSIGTFENTVSLNFVATDPYNTFFFKFLAK